ncbi:MAG: cytochrome c3 family protein [Bacillota bacterium]
MRGRVTVALVVVGLVLSSVAAALAAEQAKVPEIPGVTIQDPKPNGCNDCHRKVSPEKDYTLRTEIANMVKAGTHPKVSERLLQDLPKQCVTCHKPDSKQPFGEVLHKAHLVGGAENHFITAYQGQCMYCHSLDPGTGSMKVKGL